MIRIEYTMPDGRLWRYDGPANHAGEWLLSMADLESKEFPSKTVRNITVWRG